MKNTILQPPSQRIKLKTQAEIIIQRTMTQLSGSNIHLISAQAEVNTVGDLQWLAQYMLLKCNRIVVLASQCEDTNLIVAKSTNIDHLYVDEVIYSISSRFGGEYSGNNLLMHGTIYQFGKIPEIIDHAVESIVVARPSR